MRLWKVGEAHAILANIRLGCKLKLARGKLAYLAGQSITREKVYNIEPPVIMLQVFFSWINNQVFALCKDISVA